MIVSTQRPIRFINDCNCIVDAGELERAIIWFQSSPTAKTKHIYMHGQYPAVSIHKKKMHVHRLLMMYWTGGALPPNMIVHHINGNKKDARQSNLIIESASNHAHFHCKGKPISHNTRMAIVETNKLRRGMRCKMKRNDVTPQMVYDYKSMGFSFNRISKIVGLDWSCVKQRYIDFIHDNPELLKP